jgi:hypothetical protein
MVVCLGCWSVAVTAWFLSSRPRLFIRVFIPRSEWRGAIWVCAHDRNYQLACRQIAFFQFAIGSFSAIVAWLCAQAM